MKHNKRCSECGGTPILEINDITKDNDPWFIECVECGNRGSSHVFAVVAWEFWDEENQIEEDA